MQIESGVEVYGVDEESKCPIRFTLIVALVVSVAQLNLLLLPHL